MEAVKRYGQNPLICRVLNWIDPGHGQASIEKDEGGNALE